MYTCVEYQHVNLVEHDSSLPSLSPLLGSTSILLQYHFIYFDVINTFRLTSQVIPPSNLPLKPSRSSPSAKQQNQSCSID
jgi:hypothetical protein